METWFPYLTGAFLILLLGGIGAALRFGRAYWLIAGYNTMSAERKKSVDTEGLGRFLSGCLFAGAGLAAAAMLFFALGFAAGGIAALVLFLPGIVFLIVRAQRFDRNAVDENGLLRKKTKIAVISVVTFMTLAAAGVAALLAESARPAQFELANGKLEIRCVFGDSVPLGEIEGLALAQEMPGVAARTNGSALGDTLRGSFRLADGSLARIYVENASPPFIRFSRGGVAYIINRETSDGTAQLYDDLREK